MKKNFGLLILVCLTPLLNAFQTVQTKNEQEKWLHFHELNYEAFEQKDEALEMELSWLTYDLSPADRALFQSLFIYAPDSSHFIDLDSYSLLLEKGEDDELISSGTGVDMKVQLVALPKLKATTLLFCGTECYPETAVWQSDTKIDILGFTIDSQYEFVPTIWSIDLETGLLTEWRNKEVLNEAPKSYSMSQRLQHIEFTE
jgi:hypothetical protein